MSTYPPRECGIATFTQDLFRSCQKILGRSYRLKVAAFNVSPLDTYKYPKEVFWKIDQNNEQDYLNLADDINADATIQSVVIQHEYGIFGGESGKKLLIFMRACKKPILVTLHTVSPEPNENKIAVTTEIIKLASSIVVLTKASIEILKRVYGQSGSNIVVVPHGIHLVPFSVQREFKKKLGLSHHIILSTFGLLSRRKGVEYAIGALPAVIKKYPSILYLVLGETHPVIRRKEGEKYRLELVALVEKLHLEKHVRFYDQYLSLHDLLEFLQATDIYISPSINPNQTVSGTLSYAVGAGRTVISTRFTHAKELVTSDIGRLVPVKDSLAFSVAIEDLLHNTEKLRSMERYAYDTSRPMLWSNVARKYTNLISKNIPSHV